MKGVRYGDDVLDLLLRNTFGMDFPEGSKASRDRLGITGTVFPGGAHSRMMVMLSGMDQKDGPGHDGLEPGG